MRRDVRPMTLTYKDEASHLIAGLVLRPIGRKHPYRRGYANIRPDVEPS